MLDKFNYIVCKLLNWPFSLTIIFLTSIQVVVHISGSMVSFNAESIIWMNHKHSMPNTSGLKNNRFHSCISFIWHSYKGKMKREQKKRLVVVKHGYRITGKFGEVLQWFCIYWAVHSWLYTDVKTQIPVHWK